MCGAVLKEGKMANTNTKAGASDADGHEPDRRDFIVVATYAMGAVGAGAVAWPLIDQMNPAADTLALASTEVDVSKIAEGQAITVTWRGKPVFIRHRTADEIARANAIDSAELRDPEEDETRVQKPELLVVLGVCTHLGCVPLGQKTGEVKGEYDGWFCPCHGSHYDTSGRIRKGPAPTNLEVPPYSFLSDGLIRIG
jgi:ubiquinol-cytochrome c reductase iron-sulfur subunit|tara:strand:- start:535 stop:1125 length:591 start_codon:yes stop_codon:yes gene_type:complete